MHPSWSLLAEIQCKLGCNCVIMQKRYEVDTGWKNHRNGCRAFQWPLRVKGEENWWEYPLPPAACCPVSPPRTTPPQWKVTASGDDKCQDRTAPGSRTRQINCFFFPQSHHTCALLFQCSKVKVIIFYADRWYITRQSACEIVISAE